MNDLGETAEDTKRKSEEISGVFVRAEIKFLSSEEGGRKTPVTSRYRPNHVILPSKIGTSIGQIMFEGDQWVNPGEEVEAEIQFMNFAALVDHIKKGFEWDIYEGPRLVAKAKVIEVLRYE